MTEYIYCKMGGKCGGLRVWTGVAPQSGPHNLKCGPQNWTAEYYSVFLHINRFCGPWNPPRGPFCGPTLGPHYGPAPMHSICADPQTEPITARWLNVYLPTGSSKQGHPSCICLCVYPWWHGFKTECKPCIHKSTCDWVCLCAAPAIHSVVDLHLPPPNGFA